MHVGDGAGDLAKGRGLKITTAGAFVHEAGIFPCHAGIVLALIGQVGANVTGGAVALTSENLQAELLLGGESAAVAVEEAIEWRATGENRPDETGQCARDFLWWKTYTPGSFIESQVHFIRILDGLEDQASCTGSEGDPPFVWMDSYTVQFWCWCAEIFRLAAVRGDRVQ